MKHLGALPGTSRLVVRALAGRAGRRVNTIGSILQVSSFACRVTTNSEAVVVTRCSEPASPRVLAGFRKFSMGDAESDACSFLDANESPCTRPDACGL
jgi:hypothetical protein